MMYDWGFGWGGGMFFGPFVMIAGPVLLVILIVLIVRSLAASPPGVKLRSPRDILDERFAKGEIDRNEYEERRKVLGA